jgi:hypothetical protein
LGMSTRKTWRLLCRVGIIDPPIRGNKKRITITLHQILERAPDVYYALLDTGAISMLHQPSLDDVDST